MKPIFPTYILQSLQGYLPVVHRAGEMDFKVRGPWNTEKCCRPPWLNDKKNFRILDAPEWLKQWYFDLGDSLLRVSSLKPFLFCLFLPFFFLLRKKVGGRGRRGGEGNMTPPALLVLPALVQDFVFSLNIFRNFAFLILLGINSHNFGVREDILSVPK